MNKIIFIILFVSAIYGCTGKISVNKLTIAEGRNIISDSGMVVSAHPQSSRIGIAILRKGGNAVDAAVATEFALAVCYPEAGNIGGGGFMLIRQADGTTDLIDYREKAPLKASRDMYLDASGDVSEGLSTETHMASGVPGTVDGMVNIHSKYGILSFRDVIQPAIDLARKGFPLTDGQAADFNSNRQNFITRNLTPPSFVKDTPWVAGDTLRQESLAQTLERIRDRGRDGFYSGTTARLIVKEMERGNGIISGQDLSEYRASFKDPVLKEYHGYRIISASPPSGGGIVLLQILGMISPYNLKEAGFHTWQSVHLITEAERRAFADRSKFLGDPGFTEIPVDRLLDDNYLARRMSNYSKDSASSSSKIFPGSPLAAVSEETTHYSVADYLGNAVAATTTLNGTFGNSIIVDSAGFLLNNQMDDFSVKPGVPNMYGLVGGEANSIQPGKKMLSSMTPVIIEKDGKLFMIAGSPGGSTIPTSVLQVIINVIDYGMSIRQAVDTGRFHHQWLPDHISYEKNSLDSTNILKLRSMGHELRERNAIGRVNAIMILPDGKKAAGADRRGNNSACGY
ncbi:MAG TPA: gamma-glutamyltransferase [Bacteroidales bacterium]|jgi:gamma-glutamyltranspeptidase / glutathione hydrolase|nr:gamma-glutamyltransferase [Bacteroidales bacterium]HBZ20459.1 gamma-glutamyltransferase [Bacteroidales bacterium]